MYFGRRLWWVCFCAPLLARTPLVYAQAPVELHPGDAHAGQHHVEKKREHAAKRPRHVQAKPQHSEKKPEAKPPVSLAQVLYLIRSTLLTLNDANRSGNYTVLRDLAAPAFQAKNSDADLARVFSDLRQRQVDLYAVAVVAPQLTAPPHIEGTGMLRLTGIFPTRPLEIKFDLLFQDVGQQWRLFGISVATPQVSPAMARSGAQPQARK